MKKLLAGVAAAAALSLAAAAGVGAEPGIPACADINDGGAFYHVTVGPPFNAVTGFLGTVAPTCRNVTYTMFVVSYDASGNATGLAGADIHPGNGRDAFVRFEVDRVTGAFTCVFFVSRTGRTIYDVAPDAACPTSFDTTNPPVIILGPDGSPGSSSPYV
jgi:hypothetical protein